MLLGKQLELADHQVVVTESAAEALTLWQQDPLRFDLIITDCNMPGMNGFQFAEALRLYEREHQVTTHQAVWPDGFVRATHYTTLPAGRYG